MFTKEKYDGKRWDRRAVPTNERGQPIDPEHGLTMDSINELGHERFKNPNTKPNYIPPKDDTTLTPEEQQPEGQQPQQ